MITISFKLNCFAATLVMVALVCSSSAGEEQDMLDQRLAAIVQIALEFEPQLSDFKKGLFQDAEKAWEAYRPAQARLMASYTSSNKAEFDAKYREQYLKLTRERVEFLHDIYGPIGSPGSKQ